MEQDVSPADYNACEASSSKGKKEVDSEHVVLDLFSEQVQENLKLLNNNKHSPIAIRLGDGTSMEKLEQLLYGEENSISLDRIEVLDFSELIINFRNQALIQKIFDSF